jgi:hypothetical protein
VDNPYIGTEWEMSWQSGYEAGLLHPSEQLNAPSVLEANQAVAYNEGAAAGQDEAARAGTPVELNPVEEEQPESPVMFVATTAISLGGIAAERFVLSSWFVAAADILLHASIPGGPPIQDLGDPGELGKQLATVIRSMGTEDLFMPFCRNVGHSGSGDEVIEAGFWHGNVFTEFWQAYSVAEEHLAAEVESAGEVGIVHVKADSDGIEWMEVM